MSNSNRHEWYIKSLTLGHFYMINGSRNSYKFIKVTPKGFNLLNIETNKCILNKHLYSMNHYRKEIPVDETTFKFWIHCTKVLEDR